ncbi:Plastocyanin [Arthrobacter subterraneus]|uniref:Plastocyanin n=1 Tax=Arthrobacter subterraneus TaxID=335973 RepID=A0A1G8CYU4_9MICC|nr:cupredoxin domain-containing protein [Arthrobacter subterraneus]SDH50572.1 Plastocyanin [Arthrobacter subterraneus]
MNIPRSALGLVLAAALAGLAGCGSGGEPTSEAPPAETSAAETTAAEPEATAEETASWAASEPAEEAPAEEIVITIRNFEYEMPDSVPAGAEITVINEDTAPHTVTTTETEDFDAIVGGGETTTFTAPSEPGDYPFICTYHPNMTGTLTVSSDG